MRFFLFMLVPASVEMSLSRIRNLGHIPFGPVVDPHHLASWLFLNS